MILEDPPELQQYLRQLLRIPTLGKRFEIEHTGRKAWRTLHERRDANPEWFREWMTSIPTGCGCGSSVAAILAEHPPNYASPAAWFEWTVDFHNAVNVKLGKPTMTLDEARRLWRSEPMYGLVSPSVYGGIERWSISLASRVPCYGFASTSHGAASDPALRARLRRVAPDATPQQIADAGKILIVSGSHGFRRPDGGGSGAVVVAVAHGTCDYTRGFLASIDGQYDHLVAISDTVADAVESWLDRRPVVVANGVDTDRMVPTADRATLRARWGVPRDAQVIGMTGRLTPDKGLTDLLATLTAMPDAWGLLVGWGNFPAVHALIGQCGLQDRVRVHPAIEQVGDALHAIDVLMGMAKTEGFGLSIMEGMLAGLAVVTTETGIAADLLRRYGPFGPAILPVGASIADMVSAVAEAVPVSVDLSAYTSDAMAARWTEYLQSLGYK